MTLVFSGIGGMWLTQQALEPIKQSLERLKQFAANASHELRSPLSVHLPMVYFQVALFGKSPISSQVCHFLGLAFKGNRKYNYRKRLIT